MRKDVFVTLSEHIFVKLFDTIFQNQMYSFMLVYTANYDLVNQLL